MQRVIQRKGSDLVSGRINIQKKTRYTKVKIQQNTNKIMRFHLRFVVQSTFVLSAN